MATDHLEWHTPGEAPLTIFYQGVWSSQTQLSKYTGPKGFKSTAGDRVTCKNGIETVYKPFVGKEIDEIILKKLDNNPQNAFAKLSVAPIIHYFTNWRSNYKYGITVEAQEDQKETVDAHLVDVFSASFGQKIDVENHRQKYELCMSKNNNNDVILFGVSRGAATTWNAICLNKYQNVKMVILEGVFFSIRDVLANAVPYGHDAVHALMPLLFPKYDPKGPAPGNLVDEFPPDVPVIIISSLIDAVVPFTSTKKLAMALASRKKNKVYFIQLNYSAHPFYPLSDQRDKEKYTYGVHAIYKIHGLPHNEEHARKGEQIAQDALL
mmetsp:Transcript_6486/g.7044  ORF Transcript_6486/g.7044 Transcript_6486/m.7044 type:complete len:323 (+) Transcript_6486:278-1246(+)